MLNLLTHLQDYDLHAVAFQALKLVAFERWGVNYGYEEQSANGVSEADLDGAAEGLAKV